MIHRDQRLSMASRFLWIAVLMCTLSAFTIQAQVEEQETPPPTESPEETTGGSSGEQESKPTPKDASRAKPRELLEDQFDASSTDWGSYYDPQSVFCGKYDCYKILGFDYDSFGKAPPDTKIITKRYRKLSREWHPDKSKHKDAKERFVKISRAYEVLTNVETRHEYDTMRFDQEAYFKKYGTSVLWSYAPKSDLTMVIALIFIVANAFSWFSQKHRWQMVADRLTKAALEDWTTSQGGTPESKDLRETALGILNEKPAESETVKENGKGSGKKQKGAKKLSAREKKKLEEEALLPIIKALVNDMDDFGGGFHKPTWKDLLVVTVAKMPYNIGLSLLWNAKYYLRRLQKLELSDEEREVLTERAVGPVVWDTKSEEEREAMMKKELWIKENRVEWEEEQYVANLSAADQKYYAKLKKKGKAE